MANAERLVLVALTAACSDRRTMLARMRRERTLPWATTIDVAAKLPAKSGLDMLTVSQTLRAMAKAGEIECRDPLRVPLEWKPKG